MREEEFEEDWNIDIENFEKLFHRFCDPNTEISSIDKKLLYGFWTHRRKFFKNIDRVEAKRVAERRKDQRKLNKLASEAPENWFTAGAKSRAPLESEPVSSEPHSAMVPQSSRRSLLAPIPEKPSIEIDVPKRHASACIAIPETEHKSETSRERTPTESH